MRRNLLWLSILLIGISVPGTATPGPFYLESPPSPAVHPVIAIPPSPTIQPVTPASVIHPVSPASAIRPCPAIPACPAASCSFPGPTSLPPPATEQSPSQVGSLLSKAQYERLFPHHHPIYTYEALLSAASAFPLFAAEGDRETRKKELVAFFAHIAHETTDGWPGAKGGPYIWGLVYTEEQACLDGHCTQYNTAGTSPYKPIPGKSYYGRGPLQLTYAYNYGLAGQELNLPLLANPELVSHDGVIAFKTALWFWMRPQKPKPSCHEVTCGKWQPGPDDLRLGRRPGFGMTINIINGGVECNSNAPAIKALRLERIGFYKWFAAILKTDPGPDCDCAGMGTYGN